MSSRRKYAWSLAFIGLIVVSIVIFALASRNTEPTINYPRDIPGNVPPTRPLASPAVDISAQGDQQALYEWADYTSSETGIPSRALVAYGKAEQFAQNAYPECHIAWNTLAGIGHEETMHGGYNGSGFGVAEFDDAGRVINPIYGPALDGSGAFAEILDTDDGEFDNDQDYDRAVGPMQFIPESWREFGYDVADKGFIDPQNIDDAAFAAAGLLCTKGGDLDTEDGWLRAIYSYNHSRKYITDVQQTAEMYAMMTLPDPEPADASESIEGDL